MSQIAPHKLANIPTQEGILGRSARRVPNILPPCCVVDKNDQECYLRIHELGQGLLIYREIYF